jgi:hypothetical protein
MKWFSFSKRKADHMTKFVRDESLKLGDKVKEQITGLSGTIIAITEWLNGCRRITVQPAALHEGKPVEACTFDAEQLVKIEEGPALTSARKGGPSISPQRPADPR